MELLVATHPSGLEHDTGPAHPERPQRVESVRRGLGDAGVPTTEIEAPPIDRAELALVHDASYIEMIETFCELGGGALDMDTFASPESWDAALRAAGAVRVLVDELSTDGDKLGYALTRPPGHHAMPDRAMGFCLFNNVAVTAAVLRSRGERVAVVDWDVHHGNGTQAMLANDPGALYVSIHQSAFYPFEGDVEDIDVGDSKGTVVNVPLPAGTASDVYRQAWTEILVPVVEQFGADWILVSAGYDAHESDQLAELRITSDDYGWMANGLSHIHPLSRTIVALEGGYDLDALRQSAAATVRGFSGVSDWDESPLVSPDSSADALAHAKRVISAHWRV